MSGTGSLLIRNLRKPDDYSKAVKAQDELLRIAIANDAKISSARKAYYKDEIPPLTQEQEKDPAELQADQAKQEADLIRNLQSLGFRYKDIQQIIGNLTPDIEFKVNQTFPSIKRRLEKDYKIELITPSFFLDWLNKYLETLDRSKGFISGGSSTKPTASSKFDIGGGDEASAFISEVETGISAEPTETEAIEVIGEKAPRAKKAQAIYSTVDEFKNADLVNKKRFLETYIKAFMQTNPDISEEELNNLSEAIDAVSGSQGINKVAPYYERKGVGGVLTDIYAVWSPVVFNRLQVVGSDLIPSKKTGEGVLQKLMRKPTKTPKGLKPIIKWSGGKNDEL
jgi:SOS response regulatory protein OraA/RecX